MNVGPDTLSRCSRSSSTGNTSPKSCRTRMHACMQPGDSCLLQWLPQLDLLITATYCPKTRLRGHGEDWHETGWQRVYFNIISPLVSRTLACVITSFEHANGGQISERVAPCLLDILHNWSIVTLRCFSRLVSDESHHNEGLINGRTKLVRA